MYSPGDGMAATVGLNVRAAAQADLDEIVRLVQIAFPDDPEFNYRFPYRDRFPEDNTTGVRREYAAYLDQPEKFAVMVVTTSDTNESEVQGHPIIALAVWDISVLTAAANDTSMPPHLL